MSDVPQTTLEDVMHQVEVELHAWSGSKKMEFRDWAREEVQALNAYPSDTLHKQGRLVSMMYALYAAKDKKLKQDCINALTGVLYYAHQMLHEQNIALEAEIDDANHQLQTMRGKYMSSQDENDQCANRITQLKKELRDAHNEIETLETSRSREKDERDSSLRDLAKELEETKSTNALELEQRKTRIESLIEQCNQFSRKLDEQRAIEESLTGSVLQLQQQKDQDDKTMSTLSAQVRRLEAQIEAHQCSTNARELQRDLDELQQIHAKCYPAFSKQRSAAQNAHHEIDRLNERWNADNKRIESLEAHIRRIEAQRSANPQTNAAVQEIHRQYSELQQIHNQCDIQIGLLKKAYKEHRVEKENLLRKELEQEKEIAKEKQALATLRLDMEEKESECQVLSRERIFLRDQLANVRRPQYPASLPSDGQLEEQSDRRSERGFRKTMHYDGFTGAIGGKCLEMDTDLPRPYKRATERVGAQDDREYSSLDEEYYPRKNRISKKRNSSPDEEHSSSPPRRAHRRRESRDPRRGRGGGGGGDSSAGSSDSSEEELPRSQSRAYKSSLKTSKGREHSEKTLRNIKTIRGMLHPLFSKNGKTSVQDHVALYANLMKTLSMSDDKQLIKYLSWTFASDSQSFFLARDIKDFTEWSEYKREVIKHFSPHRNKQEALQYALSQTCSESQHPREFLQTLKNAFGQAHSVVNFEGAEFKNTFFFGLPQTMRVQMARDFNERRSLRWILEQAVNIFEVSRPTEKENKDQGKTKASAPSKVHEITKENQLPLEAGAKPGKKEGEKESKQKQKPKKAKKESTGGSESASPPTGNSDFFVSPKYKGTKPVPNYVYQSPQEKKNAASRPSEREGLRQSPSRETREGSPERQNPSGSQYEGSQERRPYSSGNSYRSYSDYRERSPDRYGRAYPDERFTTMERRVQNLCETMNQMMSETRRSRTNSESNTPSNSNQQE